MAQPNRFEPLDIASLEVRLLQLPVGAALQLLDALDSDAFNHVVEPHLQIFVNDLLQLEGLALSDLLDLILDNLPEGLVGLLGVEEKLHLKCGVR